MTESSLPGLMRVGGVVVLTGPAARSALQAVKIAIRSRRANGAPESRDYAELAVALADAVTAADGHPAVRETVEMLPSKEQPTMTADDAAQVLGVGVRHACRLAPRLGGHKIAGRWFLDEQAVVEHGEWRRGGQSRQIGTHQNSCGNG